ncbi:FecR/PupR family sigma factor regulator [Steroidobacter sp.]|uniref:FecR/PupR family sigma factor regulator n=1 Tax=Steroidobacter sp. TaxID=1978227 RepID=UPI001A423972|nr:FecR/PupR family sigma factor regulator [Steroidobacter sp.]MBL8271003.1 FecR/PupR family sigma factor regulator [Steroidobacter sp.]
MPDRPQNKTSKLIAQQAAEWLASLRDGPMSKADRLAYVRWLKQSPLHVRAMLEMASLEGLLRSSDLEGRGRTLSKLVAIFT